MVKPAIPATAEFHHLPVDDVRAAVSLYAQGWFPMDGPEEPELPWYAPDPRTVFELDPESRARTRRVVRRSLARDPGWQLRADTAFGAVLGACADREETWITPRLIELYRALHRAGWAHSWELWAEQRLVAGILGVAVGRAVMLESMTHWAPHAGNVLLSRTLDVLAERGAVLCDIQLPTDHTTRLGAVQVSRAEFEARLRAAVS
jgi:leucyl/phenylalanyl-tRNA---protein transferase